MSRGNGPRRSGDRLRRGLAGLLAGACLIAALVGLGSLPLEAAETVPTRAIVTASALNVRSGPGTGHAIIGRLPEGSEVRLLEKRNGWFRIEGGGVAGWVSGDYLTARLDGVRIVVDPGHGGSDGGAYANQLVEREVNLDIALRLRAILVGRGAQVRMTREAREPNLPLSSRTGMANAWPAHMLISVHNNAAANTAARGLTTIWGNAPQSESLARAILDRVLYWTATRMGFDHRRFGNGVYRDTQLRGHTLAITRDSRVPATIVEVAFLTNPQDAALLKNPAFLQAAAKGIADGAGAFLLNRLPDGAIQGGSTPPPSGGGGGTPPDSGGTSPGDGDGTAPPGGGDGDPGDQAPTEPEQPPSDEPGQPQPPEQPDNPSVPVFPDVSGTLAPEVHRARQLGLVEGFPDGRFRPQDAVRRGEFAKMVVRAVEVSRGASLPEPAGVPFRDVDRGMALYEAIAKAADQGYILGYPDKTFRPDQAITREQAAAVLQRVAGIRGVRESFPDVPDGSRFAPAVAAVAEVELMRGHTNGRFGFGEPLRRAEAAAVAVRLHDFLQQQK